MLSLVRPMSRYALPGLGSPSVRKIHVAGVSTNSTSQDPSQSQNFRISIQEPCRLRRLYRVLDPDPCIRISTRSRTTGLLQDPCLRALCKIYVSVCGGHICDPARRSMSPDACLSVSASIAMDALQQMNQNRNDATARAIRRAGHPQRVVLQT